MTETLLPAWFNVVANVGSFGALLIVFFWLGPRMLDKFSAELKEQRDTFVKEAHAERDMCERQFREMATELRHNTGVLVQEIKDGNTQQAEMLQRLADRSYDAVKELRKP